MRQIAYLILLVITGLQFISIGLAQTGDSREVWPRFCDYYELSMEKERPSYSKTMEKCEAARVEAVRRGIEVKQVLAEAEAAARGVSVAKVEAERYAELVAYMEKERAERQTRIIIALAVAAIVVVALARVYQAWLVALVARFCQARQKIAVSLSERWWKKSKGFRTLLIGSLFWSLGVILYVWLDEPYGSRIYDDDFRHMLGVIIIPPLFFGALWFSYKRFVK